jgi:hypothetical protein
VATSPFGRISIWAPNTLNSGARCNDKRHPVQCYAATRDNMMPPESHKRTQAVASAPEAHSAVYQPVTSGRHFRMAGDPSGTSAPPLVFSRTYLKAVPSGTTPNFQDSRPFTNPSDRPTDSDWGLDKALGLYGQVDGPSILITYQRTLKLTHSFRELRRFDCQLSSLPRNSGSCSRWRHLYAH